MTHLSTIPTDNTLATNNGYMRIMPMADYLGLHHQTIRRYIKQEKIPAPKIVNGIKLFDLSEIKAWLETGQVNASTKTEGLNHG